MTIEEIELRKVIKEMLSDVGINRETLKQSVKDVLNEKVEKTVKQIFQEHDIDRVIDEKVKDYIEKNIEGYVCNRLIDKVEDSLKDKFVEVDFHFSNREE